MERLLLALNIFYSVDNPKRPTQCEHDVLYVNISPEKFTDMQLTKLDDLGFAADVDADNFYSFEFGS